MPAERLEVLDALRGLALLGILVVNLEGLSLAWAFTDQLAGLPTADWDAAARTLRAVFVEGKFYSIFSLLFGLGFSIQLASAARRNDGSLRLFRRRLWVLLAIGMLHLLFVWDGDILVLYSLAGFLLIPFRHLSDHALLRWALGLLLLPVLVEAFHTATDDRLNLADRAAAMATAIDQRVTGQEEPRWDELVAEGWQGFHVVTRTGPVWRVASLLDQNRLSKVLAMFLLGLWVGRRIRLGNLVAHRPLLHRVAFHGLWLGFMGSLATAWLAALGHAHASTPGGIAHAATHAIGVTPMALAYASAVALLWTDERWRARLATLAPVGRMALTNYLLQSLCGIALFYGIGAGLGGQVGTAALVPIALLVFMLQVVVSRWWLTRFRFGPMEWVWRSLTYGRMQPMRLQR